MEDRGSSFSVFVAFFSSVEKRWLVIVKRNRHSQGAGLVVGIVLAVGVARLQDGGRGARDGGGGGGDCDAGGLFDPGLGEQGGGDGGGGGHGDLDELVALDQADQSFDAFERRLRVSLLPEQSLPQVHTLLRRRETTV